MESSFHSLSCLYSATANFEDSTQFKSSAPNFISWQAGVPKLDSSHLNYDSMLLYAAEHFL
jgi:hypothetical protein